MQSVLDRKSITTSAGRSSEMLEMVRPSLSEVNATFIWCHQYSYKKDNISQSDAFSEFVKIISLKLLSDRRIRDAYPEILEQDGFEVMVDDVQFS